MVRNLYLRALYMSETSHNVRNRDVAKNHIYIKENDNFCQIVDIILLQLHQKRLIIIVNGMSSNNGNKSTMTNKQNATEKSTTGT